MRILALDVADKRIGVAISDTTGTIARNVTTLERGNKDIAEELREINQEFNVEQIVIGIPFRIDGTEGAQAKKVREFAGRLEQKIDLPFKEWDERFTSAQAEKVLISADMKRNKRKSVIDQVSATLILQSYLDNLNRKT